MQYQWNILALSPLLFSQLNELTHISFLIDMCNGWAEREVSQHSERLLSKYYGFYFLLPLSYHHQQ